MTRISKKVTKGVTSEQFNEALAQYAVDDAKENQIKAKMDADITRIREKYADDLAEIADRKVKSIEVAETYATENMQLFEKKKSMETTHGIVGFRTGTPKLKTLKGVTWPKVLERLKAYLPSYVRTTEEPAKDRLLIDRQTPEVAENLTNCGLEVVQDETFFIELKKEEVAA